MKLTIPALLLFLLSCNNSYKYTGYETDNVYTNGQVLQPDSLHNDVRTVTNADSLNYWILNAASDSDLIYAVKNFTR